VQAKTDRFSMEIAKGQDDKRPVVSVLTCIMRVVA